MFSQKFIAALAEFPLMRLEFVIAFSAPTTLPSYSGSLIHGFLGHAIKSVSERAFQICYLNDNAQQPRPYSIIPDLREKTSFNEGETFRFEVKLFGQAYQLSQTIIDAVKAWETKGLGTLRTHYKVVSVNQLVAGKRAISLSANSLATQLDPNYFDLNFLSKCNNSNVFLTTPLYIKNNNQVLQHAPEPDLFIKSIIRRFNLLFNHWVKDDPEIIELAFQSAPNYSLPENIENTYTVNWDRFSKKMGKNIPLSGIKGNLKWKGNLIQYLPWLAIGEQLQVGGKTTFGYGSFDLSA